MSFAYVRYAGLAGDVAEELQRRRHLVRRRQVIDQLGGDARVGQVLLDERGVFGVVLLRRRLRLRRRRRPRRERDRANTTHAEWPATLLRLDISSPPRQQRLG